MAKDTFYITTPLYYVNAKPHIGHAYTTLAADVISRHKKMNGRKVFFQTGTDEHGSNIQKTAAQQNVAPLKLADGICAEFKKAWDKLNVEYDYFLRTTDRKHEKRVQEIFEHLIKNGDIYPGKYEGLYCSSCENFFEKAELLEEILCPVHKKKVESVSEETYFFKLSKYEKLLLKHYEENPGFLSPRRRGREIVNFVKSGLRDLSVSRTKVSWGISVLSNPSHTIYVWFDALLNYITGPGFGVGEENGAFSGIWPADIHLVGKEIYRFHSVIWPAMLMALGLPLPRKVFGHGWWTVEGEKMSKSKGNFIDPVKACDDFGLDALRYFIFREVSFGQDGDFSFEMLKKRHNNDLANDLGNLFSRSLNLAFKYLDEMPGESANSYPALSEADRDINSLMDNFELTEALNRVWQTISLMNKKIDEEKPWKTAKSDPKKAAATLREMVESLRFISRWIYPFMPGTAEKMRAYLDADKFRENRKAKPPVLFPRKL